MTSSICCHSLLLHIFRTFSFSTCYATVYHSVLNQCPVFLLYYQLLLLLLLLLLLHPFNCLFSRTTWVSRHQKGKPFWILLDQEMMGSSGISWTICKSFAPRSGQITTPVPHHLVFTGRMPFLPPNQQRRSIEDNIAVLFNATLIQSGKVERLWYRALCGGCKCHTSVPCADSGHGSDGAGRRRAGHFTGQYDVVTGHSFSRTTNN